MVNNEGLIGSGLPLPLSDKQDKQRIKEVLALAREAAGCPPQCPSEHPLGAGALGEDTLGADNPSIDTSGAHNSGIDNVQTATPSRASRENRLDIPIAAQVYDPDGNLLASARNQRELWGDPTAHAEILALRQAAQVLGDSWRLEDCELVVSLEPCPMCAGAASAARIKRILFAAYEPNTGACGSVWDIPREAPLHPMQVRGGVCRDEAEELLRSFFQQRR